MNLVLNFRLELGLLYGQVTVRVGLLVAWSRGRCR